MFENATRQPRARSYATRSTTTATTKSTRAADAQPGRPKLAGRGRSKSAIVALVAMECRPVKKAASSVRGGLAKVRSSTAVQNAHRTSSGRCATMASIKTAMACETAKILIVHLPAVAVTVKAARLEVHAGVMTLCTAVGAAKSACQTVRGACVEKFPKRPRAAAASSMIRVAARAQESAVRKVSAAAEGLPLEFVLIRGRAAVKAWSVRAHCA